MHCSGEKISNRAFLCGSFAAAAPCCAPSPPLLWPPLPGVIKPDSVVVFYPTRYDINKVTSTIACPVAAFFAEYDVLPGATVGDAHSLREKLLLNDQVEFSNGAFFFIIFRRFNDLSNL